MNAQEINTIFRTAIADYHVLDSVDTVFVPKYTDNQFAALLYQKNWIDTVQWHFEDIIRNPTGEPAFLMTIKRRIDASNQHRTDVVEQLDEYIFETLRAVKVVERARLNSETPAWLLDKMSILQLKIYHFEAQSLQKDQSEDLKKSVLEKLHILQIQEQDLAQCYKELMEDLQNGVKYMRLYKQMKMYNDPNLNPILKGRS
jgi:Protein of unknown function (DUF4254)